MTSPLSFLVGACCGVVFILSVEFASDWYHRRRSARRGVNR